MTAILDTSFLFALTDQGDRNHQRVLAIAQSVNEPLVLPVVVLPEVCYTITRVYTLDRRDFSIIRPSHCDYFELFP